MIRSECSIRNLKVHAALQGCIRNNYGPKRLSTAWRYTRSIHVHTRVRCSVEQLSQELLRATALVMLPFCAGAIVLGRFSSASIIMQGGHSGQKPSGRRVLLSTG